MTKNLQIRPEKTAALEVSRPYFVAAVQAVADAEADISRIKGELADAREVLKDMDDIVAALRALNAEMLAALKIACGYASTARRKEFEAIIARVEGQS